MHDAGTNCGLQSLRDTSPASLVLMPVAGPALRAVRDFHCQRAFGATRALRNSASAPRRYHPLLISSAAAAGAAVTQLVVRRGAHRHFIGQHKRQERRKHHERLRVYAAAGEAYAATQEKALPSPLTALGTLAVGASGSVLFAYLNTPLPWMLGALAATSVAAIWGAHDTSPRRPPTRPQSRPVQVRRQ